MVSWKLLDKTHNRGFLLREVVGLGVERVLLHEESQNLLHLGSVWRTGIQDE